MVIFSINFTCSRASSVAQETRLRFFDGEDFEGSGLSDFVVVSAESPRLMYSRTENLEGAEGFGGRAVVGFGGTGLVFVVGGGFTAPPAVIPMDWLGVVDLYQSDIMILYFFMGIGLGRTGVLEIVGVWASFPKKLDPEDLFATLILFAMPEYALSADTEGRGAGLAGAVVFEGAEMGAPLLDPTAVDPTAAVPTGLSALTLQVSFIDE